MELNKSSKKAKKTADPLSSAAAPEKAVPAKQKPRASKSSTSKKSEAKVAASPSYHHKIDSSPAAAESRLPKPETITVTEIVVSSVTQEDVAALAYSYWVARGYADGSPVEDWLRAEREFKQRG